MIKKMKPLLIAVALVFATHCSGQNPSEQPTQTSKPEPATCTVQGTVVSASTGEALKGARVVLIDRKGKAPEALTDPNGKFVISGVPAGTYHFRASKLGYAEQAYHPDASGPARLLTLAPGDKVDKVMFRLGRAGVITGRISDESGEPLVSVPVIALVSQTAMDHVKMTDFVDTMPPGMNLFEIALTDDLGEYRLYNLPPGGYYVAASDTRVQLAYMGGERPARGLDLASGLFNRIPGNHPLLYYPGVFKASEAQKIRLSAGQEAHIDLSLRPVKVLTVSGRVLDPNGKPASWADVQLASLTKSNDAFSDDLSCRTDAEGKFEIKKVLPGSYLSSANADVEDATGFRRYWTEQPVEVAGDDVSGLELQLRGEVEISGKVTALGGARLDFRTVRVYLEDASVYLRIGARTLWQNGDDVNQDGTFHLAHMGRTTYRIRVAELPDGWYVRSAAFGSQNVLENGLRLAGDDAGHSLDVTVSPEVAQVDGVVLRGDRPVPGAKVQLIPEPVNPFRQSELDRSNAAWADETGHFVVKNVAPGSYRVLAIDVENDVEEDELESPASVSVVLAEKESKTVQIKLGQMRE